MNFQRLLDLATRDRVSVYAEYDYYQEIEGCRRFGERVGDGQKGDSNPQKTRGHKTRNGGSVGWTSGEDQRIRGRTGG